MGEKRFLIGTSSTKLESKSYFEINTQDFSNLGPDCIAMIEPFTEFRAASEQNSPEKLEKNEIETFVDLTNLVVKEAHAGF